MPFFRDTDVSFLILYSKGLFVFMQCNLSKNRDKKNLFSSESKGELLSCYKHNNIKFSFSHHTKDIFSYIPFDKILFIHFTFTTLILYHCVPACLMVSQLGQSRTFRDVSHSVSIGTTNVICIAQFLLAVETRYKNRSKNWDKQKGDLKC